MDKENSSHEIKLANLEGKTQGLEEKTKVTSKEPQTQQNSHKNSYKNSHDTENDSGGDQDPGGKSLVGSRENLNKAPDNKSINRKVDGVNSTGVADIGSTENVNSANTTKARKRDWINKSKSHEGTFRHSGISERSNGSLETKVRINEKGEVTTEPIFAHLPQEYPPTQNGNLKMVTFEFTDYDPEAQSKCTKYIEKVQRGSSDFYRQHRLKLKYLAITIFAILFFVYFVFAVNHSVEGARVIIVLTSLTVGYLIFQKIWTIWGEKIYAKSCGPVVALTDRPWWKYCRWAIYCCLMLGALAFLIFDVGRDAKRLTSAGGMAVFILLAFVTSTNPARVNWRPVIWGLGLQFLLGVIILRWSAGYYFFRFLGDQVKAFLDYTDEGSKFVFGDAFEMHRMAFKVFPTVIYFSAVISIFYYWGLMQFIVCKIAWIMQLTMGTTAIESLNAACNIFIGMAESCILLRPFLHKLTKSELHAVMTGGFATVAGSYIALLVDVGAPPEHLLAAAIMSAPAALAMGKLSYPETQVSLTKTEADVHMEKTPARNVVEAASNGAIAAIKVVASIGANLIAIMGLIAFLNATLSYLGARVGFPELSFQLVCSYMFWPLAAVMGVEVADASSVASLLGTKVFVDEYISFHELNIMMEKGEIGVRSQVIATYACCGFGSIASVGVYIGALVSVAPERRGDISEVALRAVVNGNIAGFLTACIAGVLFTGDSLFFKDMVDAAFNATLNANTTSMPDILNSTISL